jgi:hypothetical protein
LFLCTTNRCRWTTQFLHRCQGIFFCLHSPSCCPLSS